MCDTCNNTFAEICENGLCKDCNDLLCYVDKNYEDLTWILNEISNYLELFILATENLECLIPAKKNVQRVTVTVLPIAIAGKKICSKCKMEYPSTFDFFYKNSSTKDGFDTWCKKCKKIYDVTYHRRTFYQVSDDKFDAMLKNQKDCCAGCGNPFGLKRIAIDHDHSTGMTRGLLCNSCNVVLGLSQENPETLRRLIRYIEDWNEFKKTESKF